jgi:hypothetical protein
MAERNRQGIVKYVCHEAINGGFFRDARVPFSTLQPKIRPEALLLILTVTESLMQFAKCYNPYFCLLPKKDFRHFGAFLLNNFPKF